MDFEDILNELGDMGKFQLTTYTLLCLPVFVAAANSLSYVFTAAVPKYRCRVPGCDESTTTYEQPWMCDILPTNEKAVTCEPLQCQMYSLISNYTANSTCSREMFNSHLVDCDSWVYTEDDWTIVSDWDLTCYKNQWLLALVGTLHFAGIVCGSGLFGFLADRYGRKLVFIFCILLMALTGIMQAISPDYITFSIFIFINALGVSGVYPLAFIIGVEMVSKKHREASGIILNYFYALGEAILGLLGYYIQNWRVLQAVVSAPALLFLVYYWFVPESVRWLIAKRKNEAANKIIKQAAKVNKIQLSEQLLLNIDFSEKKITHNRDNNGLESEIMESNIYPMLITILKSKVMVIRFAMIFYIWAANAFVYYGLSLNSTNMSGNKYINFSLVCLVEIPGYTLAWVSMNHFGRRFSLAMSFLICAIACIGAGFVPTEMWWLSTILSLLGKLGVTSSFGIVYVHTAEMIPTILRSGGVGTASTIARVGAMIAPFVPLLNIYYETLPILLFGAVSLIAAVMVMFLPETHNCKLPDTVEEAENIGKVKPPQKFIEKYTQKPID